MESHDDTTSCQATMLLLLTFKKKSFLAKKYLGKPSFYGLDTEPEPEPEPELEPELVKSRNRNRNN
jgi:hypothetical protein